MDLGDTCTMLDVRYWSAVLCYTILIHSSEPQGHRLRNVMLKNFVKVFIISLYLLNMWIDISLKFYAVPSQPVTSVTFE